MILWLAALLAVQAEPGQDVRTVRLLTIGNSFAENACKYLPDLVAADPSVRLVLGKANLGGCTLERHAGLAARSDADPAVKPYGTPAGARSLQDLLREQPWDVVTLQQMSALSYKPETYEPHLGDLVALVRRLAPTAAIRLHQTWAYRADSPILRQEGLTPDRMHERLATAYADAAKRHGLTLIPSGDAFFRARKERPEVVPDAPATAFPELPDQRTSLVVGWFWNRKADPPKLALDFKHANARGCYLLGAVWYETLFGRDVRTNAFKPKGIAEEDLAFLKRVAHETVGAAR